MSAKICLVILILPLAFAREGFVFCHPELCSVALPAKDLKKHDKQKERPRRGVSRYIVKFRYDVWFFRFFVSRARGMAQNDKNQIARLRMAN